jgi:hypothetical protein
MRYITLLGKGEGKIQFGRPRSKYKVNVTISSINRTRKFVLE